VAKKFAHAYEESERLAAELSMFQHENAENAIFERREKVLYGTSIQSCLRGPISLLLVLNFDQLHHPLFYRGPGLKLHGARFFLRFVFILNVLHLHYFSFLDMFVLRILILDETNHFKVVCVCVNKSMSVCVTKCMRVSEYEVWSVSVTRSI